MLFLPSANGPPGLVLHTVLAHEVLVGTTLVVRMRLDLVDGRRDLVVIDQIHEPVGIEIRYADRLGVTLAVQLLHRAPPAVVVTERLMNQVEVDVVETEPLERRPKA